MLLLLLLPSIMELHCLIYLSCFYFHFWDLPLLNWIHIFLSIYSCFLSQEIYSVKLPGNPKLGEGKPENQNHAVIFTRGNAVQTIDMNQVISVLISVFDCHDSYRSVLYSHCLSPPIL